MAGVDAEVDPVKFEDVRDNDYVQLIGVEYAFSDNLALSGWYYNLSNPHTDNLLYIISPMLTACMVLSMKLPDSTHIVT